MPGARRSLRRARAGVWFWDRADRCSPVGLRAWPHQWCHRRSGVLHADLRGNQTGKMKPQATLDHVGGQVQVRKGEQGERNAGHGIAPCSKGPAAGKRPPAQKRWDRGCQAPVRRRILSAWAAKVVSRTSGLASGRKPNGQKNSPLSPMHRLQQADHPRTRLPPNGVNQKHDMDVTWG